MALIFDFLANGPILGVSFDLDEITLTLSANGLPLAY